MISVYKGDTLVVVRYSPGTRVRVVEPENCGPSGPARHLLDRVGVCFGTDRHGNVILSFDGMSYPVHVAPAFTVPVVRIGMPA